MSPWIPFFYYYGFGGLLFVLSIGGALYTGATTLKLRRHRKVIISLSCALSLFFLLHFVWILLAENTR